MINVSGNKLDQYVLHQGDGHHRHGGIRDGGHLDRRRLTNATPSGQSQYIAGPFPGVPVGYGGYYGVVAANLPAAASQISMTGAGPLAVKGGEGPTWVVGAPLTLTQGGAGHGCGSLPDARAARFHDGGAIGPGTRRAMDSQRPDVRGHCSHHHHVVSLPFRSGATGEAGAAGSTGGCSHYCWWVDSSGPGTTGWRRLRVATEFGTISWARGYTRRPVWAFSSGGFAIVGSEFGRLCDIRRPVHVPGGPQCTDRVFGVGCILDEGFTLENRGVIDVGDHTVFGHHCTIAADQSIVIGRRCLIGELVSIRDHDHSFASIHHPHHRPGS